MASEHTGIDLLPLITLLGAGVVAAPLFKRLGLGAVLGYLAAGMAIGPFGLRLFTEPAAMLQVAELGVVLFLFLVGLEMRPSRLWSMRRQLFGLGLVQVVVCAGLLTAVGLAAGLPLAMAFVAGSGFVLTSTAIVMQLLEERRELGSGAGQRIVSVLLLEDLLIVPMLAVVALLATGHETTGSSFDLAAVGVAALSIGGLILAGRYLLNPLFGLLANARAREVMTAAALLVALGAAYVLEHGGLSMAMGAFVAGVLLSESGYRHQLEVDVEPFRGILLGLFFMAVGMSLDFGLVAAHGWSVVGHVVAYMGVKAAGIYTVARLFRAAHDEALHRTACMAQGGEFAFVLYAAAASAGIVTAEQNALLTAVVIVSMALTPVLMALLSRAQRRTRSGDVREHPEGLRGNALVIGFGRVGQIAGQFLLSRDCSVSIIDTDVEMIDVARSHDFEVYYGDGTRLDILHAAGVAQARVVLICVDDAAACTRITELLKAEFPQLPVIARARDRVHSLELIRSGADAQVRETFEAAAKMGSLALQALAVDETEIDEIARAVRVRDERRLKAELAGGIEAGSAFFSGRRAAPVDLPPTSPPSPGGGAR